MSYFEIRGRRYPIPGGEAVIGSDPSSAVPLSGAGVERTHVILQTLPDGKIAIRRATPDVDILINGVKLGPQPTPLLHGDKIEIAGQELLFVDDRRAGSTQFVRALVTPDPGSAGAGSADAPRAATGRTGGRLVSLTDGREYEVSTGSLVIGREAGCEVVISSKKVSRRHAEIVSTPRGYILIDNSTNGTLVNGERVKGQRMLARADVITCGDHEFRFYADTAEPPPATSPRADEPARVPLGADQRLAHTMHGIPAAKRPSPSTPPADVVKSDGPPTGAEHRLADTMHGMKPPPAPPPPSPPPGAERQLSETLHGIPAFVPKDRAAKQDSQAGQGVLANLIVRKGPLKGQRYSIKIPIVNIGRANYNDIVIPDESVSTVHAKLQRREGIWVLVDLDSTNGTFVDGARVSTEAALAPAALIRFGDVRLTFEPNDDSAAAEQGGATRVLPALKLTPPAGPRTTDRSVDDRGHEGAPGTSRES